MKRREGGTVERKREKLCGFVADWGRGGREQGSRSGRHRTLPLRLQSTCPPPRASPVRTSVVVLVSSTLLARRIPSFVHTPSICLGSAQDPSRPSRPDYDHGAIRFYILERLRQAQAELGPGGWPVCLSEGSARADLFSDWDPPPHWFTVAQYSLDHTHWKFGFGAHNTQCNKEMDTVPPRWW